MKESQWKLHLDRWSGCNECSLHATRKHVVLARGTIPCDVLFVGEAPGQSEDVIGSPFVGPAGKLLDLMIFKALGDVKICNKCSPKFRGAFVDPDEKIQICVEGHTSKVIGREIRVAFTNVIGCIPKGEHGNKLSQPSKESIRACSTRLREFFELTKPKLVVAVGKVSAESLSHKDFQDYYREGDEILHPAFILRSGEDVKNVHIQNTISSIRTLVLEE